jgi:hypothetical protein
MLRSKTFFFILILGVSLHLTGWAASAPWLIANASSSSGAPIAPETNIAGKNPFSIHITLGFPAEISDNKSTPAKPVVNDTAATSHTANSNPRIYEYETDAGTLWHHTSAALRQAMSLDADMVYIHVNPFADFNTATTDIRNKLMEYNKPMTVFLDNGADKNGAIISVRPDTASASGNKSGTKTAVYSLNSTQVREKYKTYVNSMMNGTTSSPENKSVSDASLTNWINNNTTLPKENLQSSSASTGTGKTTHPVMFSYQPHVFEKVLDFLLTPFISFLLIVIMGLGFLFEIRKPGTGFPIFASIFSAVLFFTPLRMDGLAENYEILLFITGTVLLLLHFVWFKNTWWLPITGTLLSSAGLLLCLEPSWILSGSWEDKQALILKPLLTVSGAISSITIIYRVFLKQGTGGERTIRYAKTEGLPGQIL